MRISESEKDRLSAEALALTKQPAECLIGHWRGKRGVWIGPAMGLGELYSWSKLRELFPPAKPPKPSPLVNRAKLPWFSRRAIYLREKAA